MKYWVVVVVMSLGVLAFGSLAAMEAHKLIFPDVPVRDGCHVTQTSGQWEDF